MVHVFVLAAFLELFATTTHAADIYAEVDGVAHIPKPGGGVTEIFESASVLPNGGRAFDFLEFSHGGALCSAFTGQQDYLCARASARVEIDRRLVQTSTYVGTATSIRLKAQSWLDYRNVNVNVNLTFVAQLWGRATVSIPIVCSGSVEPPLGGLRVHYRLDGEHDVSSSNPAVTVTAPRPFETCTGGQCVIDLPSFDCPPEGTTYNLYIDLFPRIQINSIGQTGWTVQAVSDYSHTMTLEGMDVLDANGDPMPDVRVVVPGANAGINDTFLTSAEHGEDAANSTTTTIVGSTTSTTGVVTTTTVGGASTTTTTVGGASTTTTTVGGASTTTTTTTGGATTTTTLPPCAGTIGLQAADCRCDLSLAGCDGLKRPIARGLAKACRTIDKAVAATGKAQRRLGQRAAAAARRTLAKVNGRKGDALPDGCREELRTFLGALGSDLMSPVR